MQYVNLIVRQSTGKFSILQKSHCSLYKVYVNPIWGFLFFRKGMLLSVQKHFLESFKSFFVDDFIVDDFNEKVSDFTFNTYQCPE